MEQSAVGVGEGREHGLKAAAAVFLPGVQHFKQAEQGVREVFRFIVGDVVLELAVAEHLGILGVHAEDQPYNELVEGLLVNRVVHIPVAGSQGVVQALD